MQRTRNTELDDTDVWLMRPAMVPAHPPLIDTVLLSVALVILSGNLPAVLVHTLLGLKGMPVWPLYLAIYGAVGLLLAAHVAKAMRLASVAAPILGLSLLPLVSAAWSAVPIETTVQAATLAGTALTGFCLAALMPAAAALRTLAIVGSINPCLDLLSIVALPSVGIEQSGPWVGTWRGLHDQKNGLGAYATVQLMLILAHVRHERRMDMLCSFGILLNLFMLVAAKSTTAMLTTAVSIPLLLAPGALLWLLGRLWLIAISVLIVWLMVDPDLLRALLESVPALVGKDSTVSNRFPVWAVLAPYIEAAPWLGYGYGAFWSDPIMPGEVFMSLIKFLPGSAHSSYFEVRLGLGYIGLAATLAVLVWHVANLWRCDRDRPTSEKSPLAPLAHAMLAFTIFLSLTESAVLTRNDLFWALLVWLAVAIADDARARRMAWSGA